MCYFKIPTGAWLINLLLVTLGILAAYFSNKLISVFKSTGSSLIISISVVLLLLTFMDKGLTGVHRWISTGNFKLNIGVIVAPLLLIQISKTEGIEQAIFTTALVTILFLLQPDASQVTAFSIPASVLLMAKMKNKAASLLAIALILTSVIVAWCCLDSLPAVSYVEKIVQMAGQISPLYFVVAVLSLALLHLPFFAGYVIKRELVFLATGLYFLLSILSSFFGNFPVMIMGYGISPIIGYFIGLIWLINGINNHHKKVNA